MPNLVPMSLSLWAGIYQVLFAFQPRRARRAHGAVRTARVRAAGAARTASARRCSRRPRSSCSPTTPRSTTLEPLRYVRSVSAPLSPAHARAFHERFGVAILNGYGQTELGGEAVGWSAAEWKEFGPAKLGAVGRPHRGFELRTRTDRRRHRAAPTRSASSRSGRTPGCRPTIAAVEGRVTADGWLRTGDLARIDADGFVWIEGRVSAMINRGGLKVFPDEVEECIRGIAGVDDVAVAGVADERLGEVPWAFVVGRGRPRRRCRPGAAPRSRPTRSRPASRSVAALPRNEMGKVLRQDLVPLASSA